jgi:hypothetical protein
MGFYLVVGLASLCLLPVSYKRSGSMTRYVTISGAPIVWLLLAFAAGSAAVIERTGGAGTSQAVFTGGLIGTAFVQIVLLRRGTSGLAAGEGDQGGPPQRRPERTRDEPVDKPRDGELHRDRGEH